MSKDKRKLYLTGLTPLGYSFLFLLIVALILDIFNHQIPAVYSIGLWIVILVLEVVGIIRKSDKIGDTLSESLWWVSQGYKTRRRLISFVGAGIAFKICSFGFILPKGGNIFVDLPWQGDWFILSKVYLICLSFGVGFWLWDHFLLAGRDG